MIDRRLVRMFVPPEHPLRGRLAGRRFHDLVADTVGGPIRDLGELDAMPLSAAPAITGSAGVSGLLARWRAGQRPLWLYWDRGYLRPSAFDRWTVRGCQMTRIRPVPDDRWRALGLPRPAPWCRSGAKILVAAPSDTYAALHGLPADWTQQAVDRIACATDRPIVVREKGSDVPLARDLADAFALVTHGSAAAIEAVMLGIPVFVDETSAAAPVGSLCLDRIERPHYAPDREPWLWSLAYSQFSRDEQLDGTVWKLVE